MSITVTIIFRIVLLIQIVSNDSTLTLSLSKKELLDVHSRGTIKVARARKKEGGVQHGWLYTKRSRNIYGSRSRVVTVGLADVNSLTRGYDYGQW